jgi:hypothetical protein
MASVVADITATASPIAETEALFKTSFLRDGSSGKSFAIVQANESVTALSYAVYERNGDVFSSGHFEGSINASAPTFSFTITKGSKYWVIAHINNELSAVHFEVDPNKRRLGVGAGKKRAAAPDSAPADPAAPAAAASTSAAADADKAPAAPAADKPRSKKIKA